MQSFTPPLIQEQADPLPTASTLLSIIRNARELGQAELMKQAVELGFRDEDITNALGRLIKEKQIGFTKEGGVLRFFATDDSVIANSDTKRKELSIIGFLKENRERGLNFLFI